LNVPSKEKPPEKIEPEKTDASISASAYGLQVGVFKTREAANSERDKYSDMRFRTEIIEKTVEGEKMYAVVVGHYSTKTYANTARQNVKQHCDCDPIVLAIP